MELDWYCWDIDLMDLIKCQIIKKIKWNKCGLIITKCSSKKMSNC